MKEKMKNVIQYCYHDLIAVVVMLGMITIMLFHFLNLGSVVDWSVPFRYIGTDEMSTLVETKMTADTGWNLGTDRLGGTEGLNNANNIITGMHNADQLTIKIFLGITGNDIGKTVNFTYLSAFYLISLISYIVLRCVKIKRWISVAGSITYAFLPFIFIRNQEHLVLSCYYFIPLLVLLCLWIYEDDSFLKLNKDFFKYPRNIAAIVMTCCIANSGIVYWQFFGCFFLAVTAFVNVVRTKKLRFVRQAILCIVGILIFMILGCMPEIIDMLSGGSGIAGRVRSIPDAELYGLKLIQLILPLRGHGINYLEGRVSEYNATAPLITENVSAYLGMVGIIGLVVLGCMLFKRKAENDSQNYKRLSALSELNIFGILMGTIGGMGTCFFVFVSQTLRGYNRISVYIAFFCITAVCIIVQEGSIRIKKRVLYIVYAVGMCLLALFGVWESTPKVTFDYEVSYGKWYAEDAFIKEIEAAVPKNSLIYELPYLKYPEGGTLNGMHDLELMAGYIHSDTLRWSFAATYEGENDLWNQSVSEMESPEMISALKENGYAGIYINRSGFASKEEWSAIEKELTEQLNVQPLISVDDNLSFFIIQ